MDGMPMPGGWTPSMVWMRMPGQTWPGAAASFLGMWVPMMVAMMLPSLVPTLWRWRQSVVASGALRSVLLTVVVGAGYFLVWTVLGAAVFPIGAALAAIETRHPALAHVAPITVGVVVMIAGLLQRTAWKARHLACCRAEHSHGASPSDVAGTAWRHGIRLGVHCGYSCAAPMASLLALGVMNLRAMAVVTAVVTIERLAPAGARVARLTGMVAIAAGMSLIVRAAASG